MINTFRRKFKFRRKKSQDNTLFLIEILSGYNHLIELHRDTVTDINQSFSLFLAFYLQDKIKDNSIDFLQSINKHYEHILPPRTSDVRGNAMVE